jgi:hypothetical protein
MLFILITFTINSSNLKRNILTYILSLSFIINVNVIVNLSLILKASLISRIAL